MVAVRDALRRVEAGDYDEEVQVFDGDAGVSRRIYQLSREVIEFQRAVKPLSGILGGLIAGSEKYGVDPELQRYLRDVREHSGEAALDCIYVAESMMLR